MGYKGPRGIELVQGEQFVLEPSSAHVTIGTNTIGTNRYYVYGERARYIFQCNLTAAANLVGDTLDVYIDAELPDGAWGNAIHFPQMLGNGGAKDYYAVLDASNPGTACIDVTSDAAVNTVRPAVFGPSFRVRYTIAGGGAQSFTFAVQVYAIGARI
jgi:hypothetical protein